MFRTVFRRQFSILKDITLKTSTNLCLEVEISIPMENSINEKVKNTKSVWNYEQGS